MQAVFCDYGDWLCVSLALRPCFQTPNGHLMVSSNTEHRMETDKAWGLSPSLAEQDGTRPPPALPCHIAQTTLLYCNVAHSHGMPYWPLTIFGIFSPSCRAKSAGNRDT